MNEKKNLHVFMMVFSIIVFAIVGCSEKSSSAYVDDVVYSYVRPVDYSGAMGVFRNQGFQMDTVTLSSKYLKCRTESSTFDCTRYYSCALDETHDDMIDCDTVYLNYGESKLYDFSFEVDVPPLDSVEVRKIFSVFNSSVCSVLSDSILVNYWLDAYGLPEGISLLKIAKIDGFDWAAKDLNVNDSIISDDKFVVSENKQCVAPSFPPDSLEQFAYCRIIESCDSSKDVNILDNLCISGEKMSEEHLAQDVRMLHKYFFVSTRTSPLQADTVVEWTLVYTDQYGRRDSLAMTTRFK
ncbi:MAG: hypothetical protein MJZ05_09010 [Fibrobacter sp.]|nr:hypothetical protein [Fibrobacter sp.]